MPKFLVAYTISFVKEELIEAESVEDAKEKWEKLGLDAELFFIRDEEGKEVIYD